MNQPATRHVEPLWIDLSRIGSAWDEQVDAHSAAGASVLESYRHRQRRHPGKPEAEWRAGQAPHEVIEPTRRGAIERPPSRSAYLTIIGHLPLITLRPVDQLHPATIARVMEVEALLASNDVAGACRLVLAIESDLGITADDRMAAITATEPWELDLEQAMALATATANGKALQAPALVASAAAELPPHERGRSLRDVERFEKARTELLNPKLALKPEQKQARANVMARIEDGPRLLAEQAEVEAGIAETLALAEGRGEEIGTQGQARIVITRDGLWNLHARGKLTRDQYEEGCLYRKDRERRTSDLGSQLGNVGGPGGSAHDNHQFVARRHESAEASVMVGIIDRAVAIHPGHLALNMLRLVAGEGQSITIWGKGRALDRNVTSLASALDKAAQVRKDELKRRKGTGR